MQEVCLLYKNIFENGQYGFEPVIESVNDSNGFPTICVLTTNVCSINRTFVQLIEYWLRTFVQLISFAEYFNVYLNQ